MSGVRAAALLALAAGGCLREPVFRCADDGDCVGASATATGRCEATQYCSVADGACASGRRYGELSGGLADQCVGGGDAGADAGSGDLAGLIVHWPLDGDATDASGAGRDAALTGSPGFDDGQRGQALLLDGDDLIAYPDLDDTEFPLAGTLAFWRRDDGSTSPVGGFFDGFGDDRRHLYVRRLDEEQIQVAAQDPDASFFVALAEPLVDVGWHHIALTWNTTSDGFQIYVDGILATALTFDDPAFVPNQQRFEFGREMVGALDDIKLFDHVLTADEVATLP